MNVDSAVRGLAIIMRGIPGSGKTDAANRLAGGHGRIHSTNDYFIVDGKYRFNPDLLEKYHRCNLESFDADLQAGVPLVICDNTNIRFQHMEPYRDAAVKAGYLVSIMTMPHPTITEAMRRSPHHVPAHTIQRMLAQWEG